MKIKSFFNHFALTLFSVVAMGAMCVGCQHGDTFRVDGFIGGNLSSSYAVSGIISDDSTGVGITAATVVLKRDGEDKYVSGTDASGAFQMTINEQGTYVMVASARGYDPDSTTVSISDDIQMAVRYLSLKRNADYVEPGGNGGNGGNGGSGGNGGEGGGEPGGVSGVKDWLLSSELELNEEDDNMYQGYYTTRQYGTGNHHANVKVLFSFPTDDMVAMSESKDGVVLQNLTLTMQAVYPNVHTNVIPNKAMLLGVRISAPDDKIVTLDNTRQAYIEFETDLTYSNFYQAMRYVDGEWQSVQSNRLENGHIRIPIGEIGYNYVADGGILGEYGLFMDYDMSTTDVIEGEDNYDFIERWINDTWYESYLEDYNFSYKVGSLYAPESGKDVTEALFLEFLFRTSKYGAKLTEGKSVIKLSDVKLEPKTKLILIGTQQSEKSTLSSHGIVIDRIIYGDMKVRWYKTTDLEHMGGSN